MGQIKWLKSSTATYGENVQYQVVIWKCQYKYIILIQTEHLILSALLNFQLSNLFYHCAMNVNLTIMSSKVTSVYGVCNLDY